MSNLSMTTMTMLVLLGLIFSPIAIAETKWEEDGWLRTSLANERLNNGDEFGCYGVPGMSWNADPGAVALECRNYIEERVDASLWGNNPISTYTPDSLSMVQHEIISKQGFVIHGDLTSISSSAWHNSSDVPKNLWDWYNLGRSGGSLEQIVGSVDVVKNAVEEGGLVNLYWIGRVDLATIRHDKEIEDYISNDANAWLTTWGQSWSYWVYDGCYEPSHSITEKDGEFILSFESLIKDQCTALFPERWNIPITHMIDIGDSKLISVSYNGEELSDISGQRHTKEGYSHIQNEYVHLSIADGKMVNLTIENQNYDIMGITEFWNNHSAAITIASHETTDLFKWSKRFVDQDDLVFTWLLQPRPLDEEMTWIPYVALAIGVGVILSMMVILKKEGLGPLANNK